MTALAQRPEEGTATRLTVARIEPRGPDPELLFREARRLRRRRWLIAGVVVIVAAAGVLAAVATDARTPVRPSAGRAPTAPPGPTGPAGGGGAAAHVAWADYYGQLHLGDLSGFTQRVVAQAYADPTAPLVTAGGRIFWVRSWAHNPDGSTAPVQTPEVFGFDPATGRTVQIAAGSQVMASVDRTFIYVETNRQTLAEYSLDATPKGRTLRLPEGWFLLGPSLNNDPSPVVANGILVVSNAFPHSPVEPDDGKLGIWNPSTGRVRTLGNAWQVTATYTGPHADNSLIAWNPSSCDTSSACTLIITNTANYSSRVVHSPVGPFHWGGAFSPDGRQLAVFVSSAPIHEDPTAQLALVNSRSGSLELVRGAFTWSGDSVGWAQWLPDGRHVITNGLGAPFGSIAMPLDNLVDAETGQVTPFHFATDRNRDLNMSSVIAP